MTRIYNAPRKPGRVVVARSSDPMAVAEAIVETAGVVVRYGKDLYRFDPAYVAWQRVENPIDAVSDVWRMLRHEVIDGDGELRTAPLRYSRRAAGDVAAAVAAIAPRMDSAFFDIGLNVAIDRSQWLPTLDAWVDLRSGEVRPPSCGWFAATSIATRYDPQAIASSWDSFVSRTVPADAIDTLYEFLGLLLTDETKYQRGLVLEGPPGSGKGTTARTITAVLGRGYVEATSLNRLGKDMFSVASFADARALIVQDPRVGARGRSEALEFLLNLIGEDDIVVRHMYAAGRAKKLRARVVLTCNTIPRLPDPEGAMIRRLLVIATQPVDGPADRGIDEQLAPDLPGVLNHAIKGLERLRARGDFVQPESGRSALRELQVHTTPLRLFLEECCIRDPDGWTAAEALIAAYESWLTAQGSEATSTVPRPNIISREIRKHGWETESIRETTGSRRTMLRGIRFQSPADAFLAESGIVVHDSLTITGGEVVRTYGEWIRNNDRYTAMFLDERTIVGQVIAAAKARGFDVGEVNGQIFGLGFPEGSS